MNSPLSPRRAAPGALLAAALILPTPPMPTAAAFEEAPPTWRTAAPDTNDCPRALVPPEPVTTSERLAPGAASPTPLPATQTSDCGVHAPKGFNVPDEVLAGAWMVVDLDTGEIIADKDPHGRYRPASIIKGLLAQVAIDELDLRREVTVSVESASQEGSAVGIGAGGRYTVEELLEGLILASGNDAAHALAELLGGDAATLQKVNALAQQLGTRDTVVASYSGLDAPGMSTSTYDMALIYRAAFANPTFARIAATEHTPFPGYGELPGYELYNDNGLFMNDPDGIGGKTGYTDDAGHTFVGALDRDGRRLMAVLLDTTVEHGPRAWQQAQALLDEAYRTQGGIGTLEAQATETSAAPATVAPHLEPEPTLEPAPRWISWVAVGLVALAVVSVAAWTLLRPRRGGRGRRAAHPQA